MFTVKALDCHTTESAPCLNRITNILVVFFVLGISSIKPAYSFQQQEALAQKPLERIHERSVQIRRLKRYPQTAKEDYCSVYPK